MKNPKSILITGASSGIGEALANEYAASGIKLYISGQNEARLNQVKKTCEEMGAIVYTKIINVKDEPAMKNWINECAPLDLVIANAGIALSYSTDQDLAEHTKAIFDVNVNGVFNTVHPAISIMQQANKGQIAIVSSIAGIRGLPSTLAYSTSKATVKAYGEALRGFYHSNGLEINVISPGFIRSRITNKNNFKMPFFMETPKAAKIIRRGLQRNKANITFPWQMQVLTFIARRIMPEFLLERLVRIMPKK